MKRSLIYSLPVILGSTSPVFAQIADPSRFEPVVTVERSDGSVMYSYSLDGCRFDYLDADRDSDGRTEVMYAYCPNSGMMEADIRGPYTSRPLEDFCNLKGAVCTRLNEADYLEVDLGLEIILRHSGFYDNQ